MKAPFLMFMNISIGLVLGWMTAEAFRSDAEQAEPPAQPAKEYPLPRGTPDPQDAVASITWADFIRLAPVEQDRFMDGYAATAEMYRIQGWDCVVRQYSPAGEARKAIHTHADNIKRDLADPKASNVKEIIPKILPLPVIKSVMGYASEACGQKATQPFMGAAGPR